MRPILSATRVTPPRGNRPRAAWSSCDASRAGFLAQISVFFVAACSFEPPVALSPPTDGAVGVDRTLDGGPLGEDTGTDGGPEDRGLGLDAEPADAGSPDGSDGGGLADTDGDLLDAAQPDAALDSGPARADAADAGPGGPDAQPPDATPADAGAPFACPPALGAAPARVGEIIVPHPIDRPILLADLDGDTREEIAVASAATGTLTVIDFEGACGPPILTTATGVDIASDGPIAVPWGGFVRLVGAAQGRVTFYRFQRGMGLMTGDSFGPFDSIDSIAATLQGNMISAVGRDNGSAGFATILDPAFMTQTFWTTNSRAILGRPAYFSDPSGLLPRFVARDDRSPILLRPNDSPIDFPDGSNVRPSTDPVTLQPPLLGQDSVVVVYGGLDGTTPQLRTIVVDRTNVLVQADLGAGVPARLAGSPILLTRGSSGSGSEQALAYFAMANGAVRGCRLVEEQFAGAIECLSTTADGTPIGSFDAGGALEISDRVSLLSAYVDGDAHPDPIVTAAASGAIHFRTIDLSVQSAPPVMLGAAVVETPAVSVDFFQRYGAAGSLLFVPHANGRLSLIAWAKPAGAGSRDRLWPQHRKDASRSGAL